MGNVLSHASESSGKGRRDRHSRVLFLLHRTWAVIATDKWTRSRLSRSRRTVNTETWSDYESQYSFCTCSQCQRDDGFSSGCASVFFESVSSMPPNSEESGRISQFPFPDDTLNKEKQRPPIYNPEDYALSLKKWGRKPPNGAPGLYSNAAVSETNICTRSRSDSFRDYRNPMLISMGSEMTLRQFGTVSELLAKLKADLRLAYPSFVQEFVADPLDGINLLLELLRIIQQNQTNNGGGAGSSNTTGKISPAIQRKALLDELSCLQCLLSCCTRYSEAVRKLTATSAGLYTLALCIMSNVNKSRVIALQLLAKACGPDGNGHSAVSEALSTLRLRFGEPVRFRFLVGMLNSAGGQGELLAAGMNFLNTFLNTAGMAQKRLYIQAELEQAGFDIANIKKNITINSPSAEQIFEELDVWEKNHIDIDTMTIRLEDAEKENDSLRDKVLLLERKIQILQEEKGILISLEQCLKERCSELQDEVTSLKSGKSPKNTSRRGSAKRISGGSTPAEDEGISSSERSLTPEEDIQRESSIYEVYSLQSETIPMRKSSKTSKKSDANEDEEETTIEEVMEELRNIINDAETEEKIKENGRKRSASKIQMRVDTNVAIEDSSVLNGESEIVPSNLHPQPPRRTRSLVHLFIPTEDYECSNKEMFFENETAYTSEEGSDSLLSASKCQLPRVDKDIQPNRGNDGRYISVYNNNPNGQYNKTNEVQRRCESFRHTVPTTQVVNARDSSIRHNSFDGMYFVTDYDNIPLTVGHQNEKHKTLDELTAQRLKSKSLDRIEDGLDSMVDIVVTNQNVDSKPAMNGSQFSRSISSVHVNANRNLCKSRQQHDDKHRMFLPTTKPNNNNKDSDAAYYFPRLQEKRNTNNSFLIKRGHTNAGLYSGQVIRDNFAQACRKSEFSSQVSSGRSIVSKVTDLPSGLY